MPLNENEALDLANEMLALAESNGAYLDEHWQELPESERKALREKNERILLKAMSLATDAVDMALEDAEINLAELKSLTQEAKDSLETIGDVRKGMEVVAALIGLGLAVLSRDIGDIAKNAKAVRDAVAG